MAVPPRPPRGYFEWRAAMAAAPPPTQTASSTSLTLAPTIHTTISFADTISDVTPLIPITLDLAAHNYYHWCHLFDIHLGRCNLRAHVAADSVPRLDDPRWVKDDLSIIQWIYTRVSTEIFNLVFREASTAAALWAALRRLFQDNADARINTLNTEIRNTVQGASSLSNYCQRLQTMADELRELGDRMDDRQLVNILLQGLGDEFRTQAAFIPLIRPYPSFAEVRSLLQSAADAIARKESRPQVFAASPRPHPPAAAAQTGQNPAAAAPAAPPPPVHPPPGWRPSPNYRGKNPMYFPPRPTPASRPAAPPPAPPTGASTSTSASPAWRPPHDPWTGLVQAWPMPWSAPSPVGAPPAYSGAWQPGMRPHTGNPGFLGVRPPAQAYYAAPTMSPFAAAPPIQYTAPMSTPVYHTDHSGVYYQPMQLPTYAATPPAPAPAPPPASPSTKVTSWDQAAFLQAMNNFAAQGNTGTAWIFDSGASSHMSSSNNML